MKKVKLPFKFLVRPLTIDQFLMMTKPQQDYYSYLIKEKEKKLKKKENGRAKDIHI